MEKSLFRGAHCLALSLSLCQTLSFGGFLSHSFTCAQLLAATTTEAAATEATEATELI